MAAYRRARRQLAASVSPKPAATTCDNSITLPAQQQQQYNRGILPVETLNALHCLIDHLNASSGRLPASIANNEAGDASHPSEPFS